MFPELLVEEMHKTGYSFEDASLLLLAAAHIANERNKDEGKQRQAVEMDPQQGHAFRALSLGCEKGKFQNSEMG